MKLVDMMYSEVAKRYKTHLMYFSIFSFWCFYIAFKTTNSYTFPYSSYQSSMKSKSYFIIKNHSKDIGKQVDILISKNQALQILYLKHHDNVYKTP